MAGKGNAETDFRSNTVANATARTGGGIFAEIANGYSEGDAATRSRVDGLVQAAAAGDPTSVSAVMAIFDRVDGESRAAMLDVARSAGEGHPLLAHAANAESPAPAAAEPAPANPKKPPRMEAAYNLSNYTGSRIKDDLRKRYGQRSGGLDATLRDEVARGKGILAGRGVPQKELRVMPAKEVLSQLTPEEYAAITNAIEADLSGSQAATGQLMLPGGRGGEAVIGALRSAIESRNAGNLESSVNLAQLFPWWRMDLRKGTVDGGLEGSPNAMNPMQLSGFIADTMGQPIDFARQIAPIIDNSIKQYHSVPPLRNSGNKANRAEYDWANFQPQPSVPGSPPGVGISEAGMQRLKNIARIQAGLPLDSSQRADRVTGSVKAPDHPFFGDLLLNRGNDIPANIGNDIIVPPVEAATPAIDQQAPPVEPSSKDVGFFNSRMQPGVPEILAGLLA